AFGEVAGTADDALRFPRTVGVAHVHGAEPDGLFEPGELFDGQHPAHHDGAADVSADLLDSLDFQAQADQFVGQLARGGLGRQCDVFAQPGNGNPHHISIPKAAVNRTSPSTMSCMSLTPWANISVRSMPRPKAQPLYRSVSTPAATSTRGVTTPQPPISIHPSEQQVRQEASGLPTEAPRHTKHSMSTSAEGSVNGKYDGRMRVRSPSPNIRSTNNWMAPRRCASVIPSSTTSPSN